MIRAFAQTGFVQQLLTNTIWSVIPHNIDLFFTISNHIHRFSDYYTLLDSVQYMNRSELNRRSMSRTLSQELKVILHWGNGNLLSFGTLKTMECQFALKHSCNTPQGRKTTEQATETTEQTNISLALLAAINLYSLFQPRTHFSPVNLDSL